jgi:hypothetical protein
MTISLVFDKFGTHPIDPGDVQQNNEQVYSLSAPSGDFLTTLNFARITQQVTLKGCPNALANSIEAFLGAYATAVVTGVNPTPNVTLDGKPYAVKTLEKGSAVTVNGSKLYPSLSFTCISNEITIV